MKKISKYFLAILSISKNISANYYYDTNPGYYQAPYINQANQYQPTHYHNQDQYPSQPLFTQPTNTQPEINPNQYKANNYYLNTNQDPVIINGYGYPYPNERPEYIVNRYAQPTTQPIEATPIYYPTPNATSHPLECTTYEDQSKAVYNYFVPIEERDFVQGPSCIEQQKILDSTLALLHLQILKHNEELHFIENQENKTFTKKEKKDLIRRKKLALKLLKKTKSQEKDLTKRQQQLYKQNNLKNSYTIYHNDKKIKFKSNHKLTKDQLEYISKQIDQYDNLTLLMQPYHKLHLLTVPGIQINAFKLKPQNQYSNPIKYTTDPTVITKLINEIEKKIENLKMQKNVAKLSENKKEVKMYKKELKEEKTTLKTLKKRLSELKKLGNYNHRYEIHTHTEQSKTMRSNQEIDAISIQNIYKKALASRDIHLLIESSAKNFKSTKISSVLNFIKKYKK